MSDVQTNENFEMMVNGLPLPSRQTRRRIVYFTILACWSVIAFILTKGSDDNTLHTSALAWSYMLMASVIFAYVFGAVVDNFNFWRQAKASEIKQ